MPSSDSQEILINNNDDFKDADKEPKAPTYAGLILILLVLGEFGLVYLINDIMPTPLTIADEKEHKKSFITERARNDLEELVRIGPRVQGSRENEEFAVDYLLNKINDIKKNAASNKRRKIEIDHQIVSGSYNLYEKTINAYGNIQNIVVKLHGRPFVKNSILINVHFDTAPTSPGGSDDGINCAAALEVLRKLSNSSEPFKNNIIFLFNGAEETALQASHAFITQHEWAKEVRVLINLEAAGASGKPMLFQVGPRKPWLLNYYRNTPHAYANVLAEELFSTGLIPSATDFGIFNEFGNLTGFDFAFTRDGYRYHTSFDGFDNIPDSSYQYIGDITLSLARTLANAEELKNVEEQPTEDTVYYDYVGLFLISYKQTVGIIMHCVTAVLVLLVIAKSLYDFRFGFHRKPILYFIITLVGILIGWILAAACVVIIGIILDAVKFSMSWYANPWLTLGLYVAPTIMCTTGFTIVLNKFNPVKVILNTSFLKIWPFIYILATILPNVPVMQFAIVSMEFMIPIAGRSGNHDNPEILIGVIALGLTLLATSFYTPLITIIRKPFITVLGLLGVCLLFLVFVFTPVGFPYSDNPNSPAPQRFLIYHASRTFRNDLNQVYKTDSGYFLLHSDRNSPHSVKRYVDELQNATSIEDDCNRSLYCGLPLRKTKVFN
ncbi:hypothetical protein ILUMI_21615, partial [Ignelater luminosus]